SPASDCPAIMPHLGMLGRRWTGPRTDTADRLCAPAKRPVFLQCSYVLALDGGVAVPFACSAGRGATDAKRQGTAPQNRQRPPPSSRQHRLLLSSDQRFALPPRRPRWEEGERTLSLPGWFHGKYRSQTFTVSSRLALTM